MGCNFSKSAINTTSEKVKINQFIVISLLGKGSFGKVCLVEYKKDLKRYALKYTFKETAVKEKQVPHILQERRLLQDISHPFICNLIYSFQDDTIVYMVLEFMKGGDLRSHMKNKKWKEDETKFVIAEISLALEYLHSKDIIHRDLKPDNILLDEFGHAYLSDFNISTTVVKKTQLKSIAGTEPYMAPELLSRSGYFCSADWWSLGVIMFEMIYGERPFRTKRRKELIKAGNFRFNSNMFVSDECRDVISGFLRMDPHTRLGVGFEGMTALKKHAFFTDIDWILLEAKQLFPVYVPEDNSSFQNDVDNAEIADLIDAMNREKPKEEVPLGNEMIILNCDFEYFDRTLEIVQKPDLMLNEKSMASKLASVFNSKIENTSFASNMPSSDWMQRFESSRMATGMSRAASKAGSIRSHRNGSMVSSSHQFQRRGSIINNPAAERKGSINNDAILERHEEPQIGVDIFNTDIIAFSRTAKRRNSVNNIQKDLPMLLMPSSIPPTMPTKRRHSFSAQVAPMAFDGLAKELDQLYRKETVIQNLKNSILKMSTEMIPSTNIKGLQHRNKPEPVDTYLNLKEEHDSYGQMKLPMRMHKQE